MQFWTRNWSTGGGLGETLEKELDSVGQQLAWPCISLPKPGWGWKWKWNPEPRCEGWRLRAKPWGGTGKALDELQVLLGSERWGHPKIICELCPGSELGLGVW